MMMEIIMAGFLALKEYLSAHVLTCLVPAFFIAGAIAVFVSRDSVIRYFGADVKKYKSYSIASISGFILAACSCTVIPLFAGIYKRGAGIGPATAFLYSGPAINILAVVFTARILGFQIGVARAVMAIVMAVVVGLCMAFLFKKTESEGAFAVQSSAHSYGGYKTIGFFIILVLILVVGASSLSWGIKGPVLVIFLAAVVYMVKFWFSGEDFEYWMRETYFLAKSIFPLLLVGVFLAGIIQAILPPHYVAKYAGKNNLQANFLAAIIGAFMYFATLTEVPIIQSLMTLGMNKGPELALLLAGPALSLPSMLAIRQILGTKKTIAYISLVVVFATISGLVYGGI
jgi:uncharacterized membrane protein YraQ (UPF0718 family)